MEPATLFVTSAFAGSLGIAAVLHSIVTVYVMRVWHISRRLLLLPVSLLLLLLPVSLLLPLFTTDQAREPSTNNMRRTNAMQQPIIVFEESSTKR